MPFAPLRAEMPVLEALPVSEASSEPSRAWKALRVSPEEPKAQQARVRRRSCTQSTAAEAREGRTLPCLREREEGAGHILHPRHKAIKCTTYQLSTFFSS